MTMSLKWICLLSLLLVAVTGCGVQQNSNTHSVAKLGSIVGGEPEPIDSFPFVVSVGVSCTGTLIAPEWVLTAGHCAGEEYILVWEKNLNPTNQGDGELVKKVRIAEELIHPDFEYSENSDAVLNDVLLLKLEEPVLGLNGQNISVRIGQAKDSALTVPGAMARVLGLGYLCEDCQSPAQVPYYKDLFGVELPIVSMADANKKESYRGAIKPGMLAAGYKEGGKDSCQGDSGGPMVVQRPNGEWVQIGITSWGEGCARPNKYGIYTDVIYYSTWIADTMSNYQPSK